MTIKSNYQALRNTAAGINLNEFHFILKISGSVATDFLNSVLPSKIYYLQSYTSLNSVLLNEDCLISDVVQLVYVDDFYYWIGSNTQKTLTLDFLYHEKSNLDVQIEDLSQEMFLYSVEGPYAWKKVGEVFGNEIHGLRIHGAMPLEVENNTGVVLRSGQSGEYAFRFIFSSTAQELILSMLNKNEVLPQATRSDVILASQETRTPCFNGSVLPGDSPFEQELRYMIDFSKSEYIYHDKIKQVSSLIDASVIAMKTSKQDVKAGEEIFYDGLLVGKVLSNGFSPKIGSTIGYLKLDLKFAHPGISEFKFSDGTALETVSSPLIQTLSTVVAME